MILADINFADVMWSMIAFFFFVIVLTMIFQIIVDVFRSDDLSGASKAIWAIFIVLLPWLAIFVYLIARGGGMAERAVRSDQEAQEQFAAYVASVAPPGRSAAGEIADAKALLESGAITQAEFDALKSKALAGA